MNITDCPKCGFGLAPGAPECPRCGIIISKFRPAGTSATEIGKKPPPYRARAHVDPPPAPGEALASERDDSRHAISAPTVAALQMARLTDSAVAVEEFAFELVTFWRRFAVLTALVLTGLFSLGLMSLKLIRA